MKFRVLSDLHIDINEDYPLTLKDNSVFTVICGDTSGDPEKSIAWIKDNVSKGIVISGNHLPYNKRHCTMQELRKEFAKAFPMNSDITYLDAEVGRVSKPVDGVLFVGSCMYTDFRLSHEIYNPTGDIKFNEDCSEFNMNDYRYGIIKREFPCGHDNDPSYIHMKARDCRNWFDNAMSKIGNVIDENEKSVNPLPVVLLTHHPLITDYLKHSYYIDTRFDRARDFNWASYASDYGTWLDSKKSIKCYCCGHIHDVDTDFRLIYRKHCDGSEYPIINNARGYVYKCHDMQFNENTFVDTDTWKVDKTPIPADILKERETRLNDRLTRYMWGGFF